MSGQLREREINFNLVKKPLNLGVCQLWSCSANNVCPKKAACLTIRNPGNHRTPQQDGVNHPSPGQLPGPETGAPETLAARILVVRQSAESYCFPVLGAYSPGTIPYSSVGFL